MKIILLHNIPMDRFTPFQSAGNKSFPPSKSLRTLSSWGMSFSPSTYQRIHFAERSQHIPRRKIFPSMLRSISRPCHTNKQLLSHDQKKMLKKQRKMENDDRITIVSSCPRVMTMKNTAAMMIGLHRTVKIVAWTKGSRNRFFTRSQNAGIFSSTSTTG